MSDFLNAEQLEDLDAYWRASNYLAVGQICLRGSPLLNRSRDMKWPPLRPWVRDPIMDVV